MFKKRKLKNNKDFSGAEEGELKRAQLFSPAPGGKCLAFGTACIT